MRVPAVAAITILAVLAGCLDNEPTNPAPSFDPDPAQPAVTFHIQDVGFDGPEPTLGVTSNGYVFFQALEKTMRSTDHGRTWQDVSSLTTAPTTLDPMLWVDPDTDRVFANHLYLACSYMSWSDDYGETWLSNPADCGVPVNDHQKVATGPYVAGGPLAPVGSNNPVYPNVVYYAYNALAGSRVAVSVDGGATFPYTALSNPPISAGEGGASCAAGLHGHITAGPDGSVYVPNRSSCQGPDGGFGGPVIARSFDNGLTWDQVLVHNEVGTADHDKNPEIAIDQENNVYLTWPGADNRLYYAWSDDHAASWSQASLVTPELGTVTMPVIQAGDPGRVAMAYYAVHDPDASRNEDGSIQAPDLTNETAQWGLYITYSLNALDPEPTWHTYNVTGDDPIQIGPISTNSGDSPPGSRNLLDFIDAVLDEDGRFLVAYADGCLEGCTEMSHSRDALGAVAILDQGPSMFETVGWLSSQG